MLEKVNVKGIVDITLYDKDGNVKHTETVNNLVTDLGKNYISRKIILSDSEQVSSIGVGSGTTAATINDTSLESELANAAISFKAVSELESNVSYFTSSFLEGVGTGTVGEIGLFSDSDPQKLLCRTVLTTPFVKASTDYLTITWKLKIG